MGVIHEYPDPKRKNVMLVSKALHLFPLSLPIRPADPAGIPRVRECPEILMIPPLDISYILAGFHQMQRRLHGRAIITH